MVRGLESLIPKKQNKNNLIKRKESVFWIEIKKIKTNPLQPRKEFNKKELRELADSIEKYGILQPLLAKKISKMVKSGEKIEYQLIAGERRLRACKMIGMNEVPVIVTEIKKEEELPISLVENIQREDLNPIEKAISFKELHEKFNLTKKEIGNIVGKSREAVSNSVRLLDLPNQIIKSVQKGEISEGHARGLLAIKGGLQMEVYKEILDKKITVKEVEDASNTKKKRSEKTLSQKIYFKEVEEKIIKKSKKKKVKIKKIKIRKIRSNIELSITFKAKDDLENFFFKGK